MNLISKIKSESLNVDWVFSFQELRVLHLAKHGKKKKMSKIPLIFTINNLGAGSKPNSTLNTHEAHSMCKTPWLYVLFKFLLTSVKGLMKEGGDGARLFHNPNSELVCHEKDILFLCIFSPICNLRITRDIFPTWPTPYRDYIVFPLLT